MASVSLINSQSSSVQTSASRFYRVTDERTSVTTAAGVNYLLITPNTTTRIRLTYAAAGGSISLTFQFFESPAVTLNGTVLTTIALRRDDVTSSELQVFFNPTLTSNGTQLSINKAVSTANLVIAPEIIAENEFILSQNTIYLLKITPAADGATVDTVISWNEVKNV